MLPAHPSPQPDELFQSWLARFARANLCEPTIFTRYYLPQVDVWVGCLNGFSKHPIFDCLSILSGVEKKRLESTTSHAFATEHFITLGDKLGRQHVLPGKGRGQRYTGRWLQYCPLCLSCDDKPYYRNKWRLTSVCMCLTHNVLLYDCCSRCQMPLNFQHTPLHCPTLAYCSSCHKNLGLSSTISLETNTPLHYFSLLIEQGLRTGFVHLTPTTPIMLPLFLTGVWILSRIFLRQHTGTKISQFFVETLHGESTVEKDMFPSNTHRGSTVLTVGERAFLFSAIGYLLQDWPTQFVDVMKVLKFTHVAFSSSTDNIPFWLEETVNQNLRKQPYHVSIDEYKSAAEFLYSRGYKVSNANVSEVAGIGRSSEFSPKRQAIISQYKNYHYVNAIFHWPSDL